MRRYLTHVPQLWCIKLHPFHYPTDRVNPDSTRCDSVAITCIKTHHPSEARRRGGDCKIRAAMVDKIPYVDRAPLAPASDGARAS